MFGFNAEQVELRFILQLSSLSVAGEKAELVARLKSSEPKDGRGLIEDKSRTAITHEELEKIKINDTVFETLMFIMAIGI
jgi:hypothetical protein